MKMKKSPVKKKKKITYYNFGSAWNAELDISSKRLTLWTRWAIQTAVKKEVFTVTWRIKRRSYCMKRGGREGGGGKIVSGTSIDRMYGIWIYEMKMRLFHNILYPFFFFSEKLFKLDVLWLESWYSCNN